jgi:hypothetical protein
MIMGERGRGRGREVGSRWKVGKGKVDEGTMRSKELPGA